MDEILGVLGLFVAFLLLLFLVLTIIAGIVDKRFQKSSEMREAETIIREYQEKIHKLDEKKLELSTKEEKIEKLKADVTEYAKQCCIQVEQYIKQQAEAFPLIAVTMSDLLTLHYEESARFLGRNPHPEYTEAFRIKEFRVDRKKLIADRKVLEYKLSYIMHLYPDIEKIFSCDFSGDLPEIEPLEELKKKLVDEFTEQVAILNEGVKREKEALALEYEKKFELLNHRENALELRATELKKEEQLIEKMRAELELCNHDAHQLLAEIIEKKIESFPFLAGMMTDMLAVRYEQAARVLEQKQRPAKAEATRIREVKKDLATVLLEKKVLEYKIAYIEKLFPNIDDIFDNGFAKETFELETEETTDRTRLFLSAEEYQSLPTVEKNQLALDRYMASNKSNWQIGRDYEMYIGYQVEKEGYAVQYTGIIQKLEDMGRDLIATKGKTCFIIQCKNWSQEKTIHEKHIFQLYGTVVLYRINHPNKNIKGVFVTATELSETAKQVAKVLDIVVLEHVLLKDFPRIKCNIGRTDGAKIYHLPFDQQYDSTVIEKRKGEFYAFTVAEAEQKGFRRAWKHFSN